MKLHEIWTIGHSTHSAERFLTMLESFSIQVLVDIRNYPGSSRYPQFNRESLEITMKEAGIAYRHMKELGGRRKPLPGSVNNAWRNEAFRGYADHMSEPDFLTAMEKLQTTASLKRTAFMCSESLWWRCHRSLVADFLKVRGWIVMHIMSPGKAEEHPYTGPARIEDGNLVYSLPENPGGLFSDQDQ